nr:AAA family ATPase [Candidatus Gracilibacteria bacterium]
MERIAIYGKGGIGKSTISTNISACFSLKGKKVLQIGCDPKRDSTKKLLQGKKITPVMEMIKSNDDFVDVKELVIRGFNGIDCIEAGGPIPGTGCAGRGISKMFEIFDDVDLLKTDYDVILFDVLGDVVCGGFASPLRVGYGEKVFIVISEEIMSMYACNNICKAVLEYSRNGIYVGGVIVNARDNNINKKVIEAFVNKINLDIIVWIPRSDVIAMAEYKAMSLAEYAPDSDVIKIFYKLNDDIVSITKAQKKLPTPMGDEEFEEFFKNLEI